jgi:hypothetical protein
MLPKFKVRKPTPSDRPKFLYPHAHWRMTPREKLPKSPLNPTDFYGDSCSRRKVTLEGSEHFIKLLPPRARCVCGGTFPGPKTPPSQVTPGTFSEATLQPTHAPPRRLKSINSNYSLPAIAFELHLVRYHSDSKHMLSQRTQYLNDLARRILTATYPTPLGALDEWKLALIPAKLLAINSRKLSRRKSLPPTYQVLWREHSRTINSRIRDVEQLIRIRSSGWMFTERDDDATVLEGSDPLADRQGDFPTDSDASNMGDPAIHPLPQTSQQTSAQLDQPSAAQPSLVGNLTPLGDSQNRCLECGAPKPLLLAQCASVDAQTFSLNSPSTPSATTPSGAPPPPAMTSVFEPTPPAPKLLHPVGSIVVAPPSPPPAPSAPDTAPSRKSRRSSAPYPEPSTRRLRPAGNHLPKAQATASRRKTHPFAPEPITKTSAKGNAPQAHAPSSTVQPDVTQTDAAVLLAETVVTQTRYQLRSHKRSANEGSTSNSHHPDERSSKRRHV